MTEQLDSPQYAFKKEPEAWEKIMRIVSDYTGVGIDKITLENKIPGARQRIYSIPRQTYYYLCKEYTSMSLKSIGYTAGKRDHSTVINGLQTIQDILDVGGVYGKKMDKDLLEMSTKIIEELGLIKSTHYLNMCEV